LLFVVFALKAALAPLHLWLPGAYGHTGLAVAALFAIMTKVGAYSILRIYSLLFGPDSGPVADLLDPWLLPLALLTVAAGTIGVLASQRLAEQAAYLVVASAGTLLTAFGIGGATAIAAGLYYLLHTTLAAAALFILADVIGRARGAIGDRLAPGPEMPRAELLGGLFLLTALVVTGMPPLSGFFGKLMILKSAVGSEWTVWVFAVLLITSLLGIMAFARSGSRLFFKTDDSKGEATTIHNTDLAGPTLLLLAGIGLVFFADPVYQFGQQAAAQVAQPTDYLQAVLQPMGEGLK
jgi:multicomponent K+:H+ antiporter subunit D